jgi:putative copper resistance protein D
VTPAGLLQLAAALLLNAGFAWLTGSLLVRRWLAGAAPANLHRLDIGAALACLAGLFLAQWAAAALMGDVALGEALAMLPAMLAQTAYGQAGLAGMAAALLLLVTPQRVWPLRLVLLASFALARASVSHAGEHGLASIDVGVEWLHLMLVGVWLGAVAVAAWAVPPLEANYRAALSRAATLALAGIVASGVFNVWQRIGAVDQMVSNPYGVALSIKLLLIAVAVALGAYNRFVGFPGAAHGQGRRALAVLRVESVVLLAALAAAAVLASQPPPG